MGYSPAVSWSPEGAALYQNLRLVNESGSVDPRDLSCLMITYDAWNKSAVVMAVVISRSIEVLPSSGVLSSSSQATWGAVLYQNLRLVN